MKTTVELPNGLVRELKVRAAKEGRTMKSLWTEAFTQLLNAQGASPGMAVTKRQLSGTMKITIEIPDELYSKVKLLTARKGVTLKELLTEGIRSMLRSKGGVETNARLKYHEMPLLKGRHEAPAGKELTPERMYEALYGSG